MEKALLDTDILSYFLKGHPDVLSRAEEYLFEFNQLTFSEITYFEILAGLEYKNAKKQIEQFELFCKESQILKLTTQSIRLSSKIYGKLRRNGVQIGSPDLLIAGIALENHLPLITNNQKHYMSISDLQVATWL